MIKKMVIFIVIFGGFDYSAATETRRERSGIESDRIFHRLI